MSRPDVPGTTARTVAVEGVRFHLYRGEPARRRRTTPALLLHGVPETASCWGGLAPELVRDRVVLAPDLKGLGDSEARGPYDARTLAAELAALVLHEVDGPVDVVGHDWGGSLALALARLRPDLVRRLVVVSAPYRQVDYTAAWHIPLFALPALPELGFRLAGDRLVHAMFDHAWRAPGRPELLEHYVAAYAPPHRVAAMLAYYRAAVWGRAGQAVAQVVDSLAAAVGRGTGWVPGRAEPAETVAAEGPAGGATAADDGDRDGDGDRAGDSDRVGGRGGDRDGDRLRVERALVVWGAADPVLPMAVGEAVVRDIGPAASLLSLPGVGHWPVEERPDVVVPAIGEFLRSV